MEEESSILLKPALVSAGRILSDPEGLYIPSYQREFAWDRSNINRLFEDVVNGLNGLSEAEDAETGVSPETFLGTVVCFRDKPKYKVVHPYVDGDLPPSVLVLLDGQQRITVMLVSRQVNS